MSHSGASDLGLHCLHMSHKKDARLISVNVMLIIIPPANFVCRGYTVFTLSVRLSVRP